MQCLLEGINSLVWWRFICILLVGPVVTGTDQLSISPFTAVCLAFPFFFFYFLVSHPFPAVLVLVLTVNVAVVIVVAMFVMIASAVVISLFLFYDNFVFHLIISCNYHFMIFSCFSPFFPTFTFPLPIFSLGLFLIWGFGRSCNEV